MRFNIKITLFTFITIIFSLAIAGFIIINSTFIEELHINIDNALNNNKFTSSVYYSIESSSDNKISNFNNKFLKNLQNIDSSGQTIIGKKSDLKLEENNTFIDKLQVGEQGYQIITHNDEYYIQVITRLNFDENDIYVETLNNISNIYNLRYKIYHIYCIVLIIVAFISSFITFVFSKYITKPIKRLRKTEEIIASGNFSKRLPTNIKSMQSPEFVSLAKDFNKMADKIESYINDLEDYNKRQDEFISKFTHELKTPLTSIIGYSDLLRTSDLEPKERHEYANYIYKEGKRLENLSFNLLQLIVLKNDKFNLEKISTKKLFYELEKSVYVLLNKYNVSLIIDAKDGYINVEPILIKSLLYNLIDNSCKASKENSKIEITGFNYNGRYQISVKDYGRGIPKDNIKNVTEAFYMVDKSRSRKQGGAGIGLSLCNEIAKIHGSKLIISSELDVGTKISFSVEVAKNEE